MQFFSTYLIKNRCFAVALLSLYILAGCSSSNDSVDVPVSNSPVANNDEFIVVKGSTTTLDLVANDQDADNDLDPASIKVVTTPVYGTLAIHQDGTAEYAHDGSSASTDQFEYTIKDAAGAVSNPALVSITIEPATPVPVSMGIYDSTVVEGADDLEFVVVLDAASTVSVSAVYETMDDSAVAGRDYSAATGLVQFAPGEVRKFITVPVLDYAAAQPGTSTRLSIRLSDPQNAVLGVSEGTGTIIDRDHMASDAAFNSNWGQEGAFTNASKCGEDCHRSDGVDMFFNGEDISPGTQWQHTVMANASHDPYWQAAVEDETESFPELAGLIEDTCTTCHAPMGRTHAHQAGSNLDNDGYYRFDTSQTEDHAREGVSCTLCHQIDAGNLGDPASFSGGYVVADASDSDYKRIYGPYANPVGNNMNMQTGHRPTQGNHVSDSALCATCHTLYTPAIDPATGAPSGASFLEQGPYLEWQNSDYATGNTQEAQCQDCHMPEPAAGYATAISLMPMSSPDRTPYGQHTLLGGNAHLLEILGEYRDELGIAGATSVSGFEQQIELTRDFLGEAASLYITPLQVDGADLAFSVDITNHAGHKLPSSYPSRRMWLHVTVRNGAGQVIFESGSPDSRGYLSTDRARLKGDCMSQHKFDGFDSSLCYEPHRDLITDAAQVAIYETVLGDIHGDMTHTLLQAAQYLKDNRIPPSGFTGSEAAVIEPQTLPVGVDGDGDFNCSAAAEGCGRDTVHYRVDIAGETGPFSAETRLLYQATQPAFVDGMHADKARVNRFKVMYDAVPPSVEELASAASP